MRIGVTGSRSWPASKNQVIERVLLQEYVAGMREIVHGGSSSVDRAADLAMRRYGWTDNEINVTRRDLVLASDKLVAFWDGKSKGTEDCIKRALRLELPVDTYLLKADGTVVLTSTVAPQKPEDPYSDD